jgi:hypothetical protein
MAASKLIQRIGDVDDRQAHLAGVLQKGGHGAHIGLTRAG